VWVKRNGTLLGGIADVLAAGLHGRGVEAELLEIPGGATPQQDQGIST
jgi:hypothetical protein